MNPSKARGREAVMIDDANLSYVTGQEAPFVSSFLT
jgi:hypothetical protein